MLKNIYQSYTIFPDEIKKNKIISDIIILINKDKKTQKILLTTFLTLLVKKKFFFGRTNQKSSYLCTLKINSLTF